MNQPLRLLSWFAVAGITWTMGYIYNVRYGGELSWLRMMYEQKMAIASQVQAPHRILIGGGSGAHYTVDAGLMQQQLGIPALNLATDGPVGLNAILPSLIDAVRPGDIVLLIPEYLILDDPDGFGDRSGQFGAAIGRPGLGGVPPQQLAQDLMLLGVPTLRALTKSSLDLVEKGQLTGYYSDPITANGDPTVLKRRTRSAWWQMRIKEPAAPYALERIQQFREQVEAKGGRLVLGLPWIYASPDDTTLNNIRTTAEKLGEISPVLYDEISLNVKTDSSLFADTHYHLNADGRRVRTTELVQQFRVVMGDDLALTPQSP
jgi:hypothetical protein